MVYLYGLHACFAALGNPRRKVERVWCTESVGRKLDDTSFVASISAPQKYYISDKKKLDSLVNEVHQGIVIQAHPLLTEPISIVKSSKMDLVVVLDQVTDPQNVGSILRLCRVFGAGALIMARARSPAETGAIAKVASGALELVPRCIVSNIADGIRQLKEFGYWSVGLAEDSSQSIRELDFSGKIALIMGSEGAGIRRLTKELCDFTAFIPTSAEFSTLNVTTATAIALYEACSRDRI
ncbi:MAG: 23S rRNA (guanosine(2251)-2'-O)-methyltransferase RlmB [Holosporales bacterium]|nr:23S rRNA (guanosine(2251)-2'-O)-methyltransferase RlmB [Holosporales bacterium]